ncbi:DUF6777 domain-containing protein [Streptomyces sp. NPDC053755]|uniref:DUF6777 domain-containing protein n=1 Tax=Streptomyces sp. NPDC053755 TaxID=3155815 RepID=UPI0034498165
MRSPLRRSRPPLPAITALASVLLVAGCSSGGASGGAGTEEPTAAFGEVLLQSATAQGPDPFTASTALTTTVAAGTTARAQAPASPAPARGRALREVTGSTPGLYGGTRSVASCDVERQVALLTENPAKARAFAESAGVPEAGVADWLRELTPVLLRTDTRVTGHGYRAGEAVPFQAVLQTGTAVLVDGYGAPRVRCACGNPLRSPVDDKGAAHSGRPWSGYRPDRVVAVTPTTTVIGSLVIVNLADNTWIERRSGSDGEGDRDPDVLPPCDPDECDLVAAPPSPPTGRDAPDAPPRSQVPPGVPTPPPDGGTGRAPGDPEDGPPSAPEPLPEPPPGQEPPPGPDTPPEQGVPREPDAPTGPDQDVPLPDDLPENLPDDLPEGLPEDLFPDDPGARQPETFEG